MPEAEVISSKAVPCDQLKIVGKALELPVVKDAVDEVSKIASPLKNMVKQGVEIISPSVERIQNKAKVIIPEDTGIYSTFGAAKEKMAAVVDNLDSLACSGLDDLTSKVPVLRSPTPDLVDSIKETSNSYIGSSKEFLASFWISQFALRIGDRGLQYVEDTLNFVGIGESKHLNPVTTRINSVRRDIRALRRNGMKRRSVSWADDDDASLYEFLANILCLNFFLSLFGLKLSSIDTKNGDKNLDKSFSDIFQGETTDLLLSDEKMADYDSDDDSDFIPGHESEESSDSDFDLNDECGDDASYELKVGSEEICTTDATMDLDEEIEVEEAAGSATDEGSSDDTTSSNSSDEDCN